jgi:hypothetical protein
MSSVPKYPEHVVEAAAKDSWVYFNRGNPKRTWELVVITLPEVVNAHRKYVSALLETGCDPEKALRLATDKKCGLEDTPGDGKWQRELALWIRGWAGNHGL